MDSNFLPTLLVVDPVSLTVFTFPVNTFSFPILKSTQLSFFILSCSLRAGFEDIKRGDSHDGYVFFVSSPTISASY